MISFQAILDKYGPKGEKTGWTYIGVPASVATVLKPGCRQSFRVKGKIDKMPLRQTALLPAGDGDFILPLNAAMRKVLGKTAGASVSVNLAADDSAFEMNAAFMECLADEPAAWTFFHSKPPSFQRYYSKWIDSAKTGQTQEKRIAMAVNALARGIEFGEMLRMQRDQSMR